MASRGHPEDRGTGAEQSPQPDSPTTSSGLGQGGLPAGSSAIEAWRTALLHRLIQYTLLCCLLSMVVIVAASQGTSLSRLLGPAAIALGLTLSLLLRRTSKQLTGLLFTLTFFCGISLMLLQSGLGAPNPFVAAVTLIGVLALCMGWRFAWFTLGAFSLLLLAIGWQFSAVGSPLQHAPQDSALLTNWIRTTSIFVTLGAISILSASYLIRKLESAVYHNGELMEALRQQNATRLHALEQHHALENQLRQAHQLEALGQLAAGVAHDFNNLLVVIMNNAQFVHEDWTRLTGSTNEDLNDLQQASQRAADLVRQLLTFSGGNVSERTRIDFRHAVNSSLQLLQRLLPSHITLLKDTMTDAGFVHGVPIELDQVVFNLYVNARDAMSDGGTLTVRTDKQVRPAPGEERPREFAHLMVKDTGEGMDELTRSKLFEPFFTTKPKTKGTGLGLSVVHGVVQQHGGFIEVCSILGKGTTFDVFFPTVAEDASTQHTPPLPRASAGVNQTLLIVDDDPGVRRVLAHLLTTNGYQVCLAANGVEALKVYGQEKDRIRLVITDAVMPQMGGRELHDRIHAMDPTMPFLFCSGYTSGTLPAEFFDRPRRKLVAKPFRSEEVLDAVERLLLL